MRSLWFTAYVVSSLTLLALAYVEWQVPGFVSSVFPLYYLLVVAGVCGVATLVTDSGARAPQRRSQVVALAIGIAASLMIFQAADAFGAYRLILALVAFGLPILLLKALSDVKE